MPGHGGYDGQQSLSPDSVLAQQQVMSNSMAFQQQMHSHAPNSLSLQGTHANIQNSAYEPRSEPIQPKFTSLNDIYFNPLQPRAMDPQRLNLNTMEPTIVPTKSFREKYGGSPQRTLRKGRKEDYRYDREASTSSLLVDKIFSEENNTAFDASSNKAKFNSSAMSIMSLSVDGISQLEYTDPNNLGPLFNSSLRLGGHANPKNAPRRSGSAEGDSSVCNYEKGMASVFEMSVNTLGDQLSDFGDSLVMRMTESQAEMSFGNVFDENDRDCYVRATAYL